MTLGDTEEPRRRIRRHKRKPSRIAQERTQELIEAAIRNIAANGYDKVTVSSICDEAGFSHGLIGHYFKGKDALLLEAVRTTAKRLGSSIREAADTAKPDYVDRIHAIIHASFSPPGFTPENLSVWVSLTGAARWSPELAAVYQDIWREYRASVGRLFERAAAVKNRKINVEQTALTLSQLIEGLWIGCNSDPDTVSPEAAEACCHAYVRQVLGEDEP